MSDKTTMPNRRFIPDPPERAVATRAMENEVRDRLQARVASMPTSRLAEKPAGSIYTETRGGRITRITRIVRKEQ